MFCTTTSTFKIQQCVSSSNCVNLLGQKQANPNLSLEPVYFLLSGHEKLSRAKDKPASSVSSKGHTEKDKKRPRFIFLFTCEMRVQSRLMPFRGNLQTGLGSTDRWAVEERSQRAEGASLQRPDKSCSLDVLLTLPG